MVVYTEAINMMINTLNNPRSVVFELMRNKSSVVFKLARSKSSVRSNGGQRITSRVPKCCRAAKRPEGEMGMNI